MKHLIVTADDFGRSPAVNAAIEQLHRAGFVAQASLMVDEPHAAEAVAIAGRNPRLCVGLHLTLCASARFPISPARAGLRYFFSRKREAALRDEIRAQFARFHSLGLPPTYWDGHAHLHLHPTVLRLTLPIAHQCGFRFARLVREPGPPALLPWIFHRLSARAVPRLAACGIGFADRVHGLRDSGRMTTPLLARLLEEMGEGTTEIYFHPGAEPAALDLELLREIAARRGIAIAPFAERPLDSNFDFKISSSHSP